jgi:uncharacterized protein YoaH (UPF0181 family)
MANKRKDSGAILRTPENAAFERALFPEQKKVQEDAVGQDLFVDAENPSSETIASILHAADQKNVEKIKIAMNNAGSDEAIATVELELKKPREERYRLELMRRVTAAMESRGYVVANIPPYKSFGFRERFLIQRAVDQKGRDVVIKIAAPDEVANGGLARESAIVAAINAAQQRARESGKSVGIEFPKLTDSWESDGLRGMATEFVANDPEAKRDLTSDDGQGSCVPLSGDCTR